MGLFMRRFVAGRLALVIGVAATLGAISAPNAKHLLAHGDDMRITFPRPADWRCFSHAACTTCTNVSANISRLIVVQGDTNQQHAHDVPPGSSVELCAE